MTKIVIKTKSFDELFEYISDKGFNPYNFAQYLKSLQSQKIDISTVKFQGKTLLGRAAEKFNIAALEILLENGADPSILTKGHNDAEWTPIYWATYQGKDSEISLLPKARGDVMDLILSYATYEKINVSSNDLILQAPNPVTAMQLLMRGVSSKNNNNASHVAKALQMLRDKMLQAPEQILAINKLHADTLEILATSTEATLESIKSKALNAITSGAQPVIIRKDYTQFTIDALNALEQKLKDPTSEEAIRTFLDMSLHPDTKNYLISKNIDFALLLDNAAIQILKKGLNPLAEGTEVFTENAEEVIKKVQTKLESDKSLLLYSNLHKNAFVCMDDATTQELKLAAIEQLKNGINPKNEGVITSHAAELIQAIASEVRSDVSKWLDIKMLDPSTIEEINKELEKVGSSIGAIEEEIQVKLKLGEDLGLPNADGAPLMLELNPNAQKAITTLYKALESNPTLLLCVTLGDNVKSLARDGCITNLERNAIDTLITANEHTNLKYTDTLYNILKEQPEKMLYILDSNIAKIKADFGDDKYDELRSVTIKSVITKGAPSLMPGKLETTFANRVFNELIQNIQNGSKIEQIKDGFTRAGEVSLVAFARNANDVVAKIHEFANTVCSTSAPVTGSTAHTTSLLSSLVSYIWSTPSSAPEQTLVKEAVTTSASGATDDITVEKAGDLAEASLDYA